MVWKLTKKLLTPSECRINRSTLASNRVYGVSTPVTAAVNDNLLLCLIQLNFIDPLPLEVQYILRDADAHMPVLYKVVRSLIYQHVTWLSASFFTHKAGEEP